jgi:hypothetical protein
MLNLPADAAARHGASATPARAWPGARPEQVRAVAQVLAGALALPALQAHFKGRGPWKKKSLPRILQTLEALGHARRKGDGWRGCP